MRPNSNPRILVLVVAYNAESTLNQVLDRIPFSKLGAGLEVLVIDDSSQDRTFEEGTQYQRSNQHLPVKVLRTPENQGYGGNQKLGYHYAIENGFDVVVLLHGDGQYAPELLPSLVEPLTGGKVDAVLGSRMMRRTRALKGGMPFYKFLGNQILTSFQNRVLGATLTEFHSGYRAYLVDALRKLPFDLNTSDFHFDTEIIIQLIRNRMRILEIPIPTYYGTEICYVNGMKYAWNVVRTTLLSRVQDLGLLYQKKYDIVSRKNLYELKLPYFSSHSMAIEAVNDGEKVLDLGCGLGLVGSEIEKRKNSTVFGVDQFRDGRPKIDSFSEQDLDLGILPADLMDDFDVVLILDVIEHLKEPERLLAEIRSRLGFRRPRVVLTTGNVAFLPVRLGLLLGWFNYGKRGILDMTHKRLYTFSSFRNLLEQEGYSIERICGIPAPYPLALGHSRLARLLLSLNQIGIMLSKRIFAYQIYVEAKAAPRLETLLEETLQVSNALKEEYDSTSSAG